MKINVYLDNSLKNFFIFLYVFYVKKSKTTAHSEKRKSKSCNCMIRHTALRTEYVIYWVPAFNSAPHPPCSVKLSISVFLTLACVVVTFLM
jgi:hypothetical protein